MRQVLRATVTAALVLTAFAAMAQGASKPIGTGAATPAEPAKPAPAIAEVKCDLASPASYSATVDDQILLDISLAHCRFRTSETGLSSLNVELMLDLNEMADVKRCQSFLVYLLFEVTTDKAGFGWPPYRAEIREGVLASVSGREQNLKLFLLHDRPATASVKLGTLLSSPDKPPNFDDIYWGQIEIFSESPGGAFSRELASKLPAQGAGGDSPDYSLTLTVKAFKPRGLCFFKSSADVTAKTESVELIFKDKAPQ